MPCTDPRDVRCLAEAFDIATIDILQWELDLVWRAVELGVDIVSQHAWQAAEDEFDPHTVSYDRGTASKDIGSANRRIGINFEGKLRGGRWIRIKVSWQMRYVIVTVHAL